MGVKGAKLEACHLHHTEYDRHIIGQRLHVHPPPQSTATRIAESWIVLEGFHCMLEMAWPIRRRNRPPPPLRGLMKLPVAPSRVGAIQTGVSASSREI